MRPGIGKVGEERRPSLDLMGQPSCKRQRERVTYLTHSPRRGGGSDGLFILMPDRVSGSRWSLSPHGRDATMIGADQINPSLCGGVRLTDGVGMTSRVGSPLHLAWGRASGSWGRAAGRQLFTGTSSVNAERGEA